MAYEWVVVAADLEPTFSGWGRQLDPGASFTLESAYDERARGHLCPSAERGGASCVATRLPMKSTNRRVSLARGLV